MLHYDTTDMLSKKIVLQGDIGWVTGHSYCVYGELFDG